MAYRELMKDFSRIRAYLRSFYVYGFQHRDDFTQKSARSYDNERRRVESWLGDYMAFRQDTEGKSVFLSVDSRSIPENPLYRAFRAKSFTDRDICLHFHVLDLLQNTGGLTITGIMDELAERMTEFESDELPDESTVRKKLKEYADLGLIGTEKRGREMVYLPAANDTDIASWDTAAAFFSEAAPLGVIGSFIQDHLSNRCSCFRYKHHYILNALDSEILEELFTAIRDQRLVSFLSRGKRRKALPMKVYIGTQSGRQYLLAWLPEDDRFAFFRADLMDGIKKEEVFACSERLNERLKMFCAHVWGVTGDDFAQTEHIEMTVYAGPDEGYIVERLEREKRCGEIRQIDETHWRFNADVFDALEMLPWIRTFTGRITDLQCTDQRVTDRFRKDLDEMKAIYGGRDHAVS